MSLPAKDVTTSACLMLQREAVQLDAMDAFDAVDAALRFVECERRCSAAYAEVVAAVGADVADAIIDAVRVGIL